MPDVRNSTSNDCLGRLQRPSNNTRIAIAVDYPPKSNVKTPRLKTEYTLVTGHKKIYGTNQEASTLLINVCCIGRCYVVYWRKCPNNLNQLRKLRAIIMTNMARYDRECNSGKHTMGINNWLLIGCKTHSTGGSKYLLH